jgi:hypothetical protein
MVRLKAFCALELGDLFSERFTLERSQALTYTADNLVQMRRWVEARVDEGVETLNDELRAAEPEQGRGRRSERERSQRFHMHLVVLPVVVSFGLCLEPALFAGLSTGLAVGLVQLCSGDNM